MLYLKINFLTGEKQERQLLKTIEGLYDRTLPEVPEPFAEHLNGIVLQEDGTVTIPKVLQPYMGGKAVLVPKNK